MIQLQGTWASMLINANVAGRHIKKLKKGLLGRVHSTRHVSEPFAIETTSRPGTSGRNPFAIGRIRSTLSCGRSPNQRFIDLLLPWYTVHHV